MTTNAKLFGCIGQPAQRPADKTQAATIPADGEDFAKRMARSYQACLSRRSSPLCEMFIAA